MALATNVDNIRFNGTGRAYAGAVAGASIDDLGELDGFNYSCEISSDQMKSTRNASRATIIDRESERNASLSFGLREQSENNVKMALLGSAINTDNQSASYVYQAEVGDEADVALADDLFVDLGHLNVFSTKLTGAITGELVVSDTLTGQTSGATAQVAHVGANFVEVVNLSGTFQAGEQVYNVEDTDYITPTGIETLEDLIVTDSTGANRRVQGTDYNLDPDYGYVRKLSDGSIVDTDVISYDYEAVERKYIHGMSAGSVEKKIVIVSDKGDRGPRQRWTFHKVKIALNGEFPLIGDGASILQVSGTVLKDTSQPSGQEYYKVEMMPQASA
ncbi:MAG: hypothetical protein PVG49_16040 [Desulfobacteraceae bacterium]|jgi:hypothetical protein